MLHAKQKKSRSKADFASSTRGQYTRITKRMVWLHECSSTDMPVSADGGSEADDQVADGCCMLTLKQVAAMARCAI